MGLEASITGLHVSTYVEDTFGASRTVAGSGLTLQL